MSDADLFHRLTFAFACCGGALVWGVSTAAFAPRRWWTQAAVALAAAGLVSGGLAAFAPDALPAAAGVSAAVVLFAVGAVRVKVAAVASRLARPRVVGLLVAMAAAAGLAAEGWRYDRLSEELAGQTLDASSGGDQPATTPVGRLAWTDRGTPVPVHAATDPRPPQEAARFERQSAVVAGYSDRWLRRGPADDHSNCHGWVFTGGRYNLFGDAVDAVLAENGYEVAADPKAGDVVVYRRNGQVAHTGVVQAVLPDATVLVESKWGRMGVYLHAAGDSPYGTEYEFRRSPRAGHLLAGLTPAATPAGGPSRAAP